MFDQSDLTELAGILQDAARTEIMPRFRNLAEAQIRTKSGPQDLVTDADEAAEARITAQLQKSFPGVEVIGEEASAKAPHLIGRLAQAALAITVDPVDGTANFAAGLPLFGVMAAVVEHGRTTAAVILDPVSGSYSAALLGQGAWEHAADGSRRALHVASPAPLAAMTGMVSWRFMQAPLRDRVLAALPGVAQTWDHRCAAHEYRALIAGHAHFVVFNRLMPWDHLPGVLLHQESGGVNACFNGTPYLPGATSGGLICAPDQPAWNAISAAFIET